MMHQQTIPHTHTSNKYHNEQLRTMTMSHWTQAEIELTTGWMEENQQLLRGKPHAWHTNICEQFFSKTQSISQLPKSKTK